MTQQPNKDALARVIEIRDHLDNHNYGMAASCARTAIKYLETQPKKEAKRDSIEQFYIDNGRRAMGLLRDAFRIIKEPDFLSWQNPDFKHYWLDKTKSLLGAALRTKAVEKFEIGAY